MKTNKNAARLDGALPQTNGAIMLTDGGLETTLVFLDGRDLPAFASFPLVSSGEGRERLRSYYRDYARAAADVGLGFVAEAPTWRAHHDWGSELGYDTAALRAVNMEAVQLMRTIGEEVGMPRPWVNSGNIGPRGDGYAIADAMSVAEAAAYHEAQVAAFADASADMILALTLNYAAEARGVVRAAKRFDMPCAIGLTVETDGRLPSGQPLGEAVREIDGEAGGPAYFVVNCAHPEHITRATAEGGAWRERVLGIRANASRCSHAELDEAEELDAGDPHDLADGVLGLQKHFPNLSVFGGCCGTDVRHVKEMAVRLARHAPIAA